ncbi:MAG: hypothetical protein ACFFD4_08205 [Candidatus Odinarchaeota archaeon]
MKQRNLMIAIIAALLVMFAAILTANSGNYALVTTTIIFYKQPVTTAVTVGDTVVVEIEISPGRTGYASPKISAVQILVTGPAGQDLIFNEAGLSIRDVTTKKASFKASEAGTYSVRAAVIAEDTSTEVPTDPEVPVAPVSYDIQHYDLVAGPGQTEFYRKLAVTASAAPADTVETSTTGAQVVETPVPGFELISLLLAVPVALIVKRWRQ